MASAASEESHKTEIVSDHMTVEDCRSKGEQTEAPQGELIAAGDEDITESHPPSIRGEEDHPPSIRGEEEGGDWTNKDVDGEVEPLKSAPSPQLPSPTEQEDHRLNHALYRSWCKFCVMGRGLGERRGRHTGRCHTIPRVGIDYFYITTGGLKSRKEIDVPETPEGEAKLVDERLKGSIVKCLIVRCHETKNVFGHVVPCKGADEDRFVTGLVVNDVSWLGHTKLILKSDQERALVALVKQALVAVRFQVEGVEKVTVEHSQKYDSQASGGTEVGVRALRGLFRSLHLCLQDRVGQVIPVNHPLTSWLLEYTALTLNACVRGDDGLTPWARARGRAFGQRIIGFGEYVYYKLPTKGPQHNANGNMAARQAPGIFLGYSVLSNSYKIALDTGELVESRAVQRVPFENRWSGEALKRVHATPWSLRPSGGARRVEFGETIVQHQRPDGPALANPRRLKITIETLKEHGFTEHCRQCDHIKAFGERKGGLPHSEACRARIVESMLATPRGAARVQDAETRIDRALAEHVAAGSAVPPPTPADIAAEAAEEASEAADTVHPPRDVRAPAGPDPLEPIDKEEDEDMDVSHVTCAKLRWAVPVVPTVLISTKRRTRNHDGRPMTERRSPYTDNSRINHDISRTIADFPVLIETLLALSPISGHTRYRRYSRTRTNTTTRCSSGSYPTSVPTRGPTNERQNRRGDVLCRKSSPLRVSPSFSQACPRAGSSRDLPWT